MKRGTRIASYLGIGVLAGLVCALIAIQLVSRTDWGMERARKFALGWLRERVHGTVTVGRISGGGLLGGVVLHDLSIVDARGRPFFQADSADARYQWRTLLSGQIVLDHVVLYRPRVHLEQLPGDTIWNYQYLFADTTPKGPRQRRLILFRDTRIVDGFATVLTPAARRGRRIEPEDTARAVLERLPGGIAKVMRFQDINGLLSRIVWESPQDSGRYFEIERATARGWVFRDPLTLRQAQGRLAIRDSIFSLDFSRVELPASSATIFGTVVAARGQNFYDLQIDADRFTFPDLQWISNRLPEDGGGSGRLRIQSQRATNSTLWYADNARIRTQGSTVAGAFGVVTGDTMYFTRVDLRASPLDVALLEKLIPGGLPVEGLLIGTVEIKGPLSALETRGNMRFAAANGPTSSMQWQGTVDARQGRYGARNLRADVQGFDLSLINAWRPGLPLDGQVTGRVTANGVVATDLRVSADLHHRGARGDTSWITGEGVVGTRDRMLDLTLEAKPFSLGALAARYPALASLEGNASGPVHVRGTADDVAYDADLRTRAGPVRVRGRLLRERDGPRYTGEAHVSSFYLNSLLDRLPLINVSGAVAFDLTGNALASVRGNLRVQLDSAQITRVPLQRSLLEARLADGVLYVDTLGAATLAGDLTAHGTLGLVPDRSGTIAADLRSASVGALEADLFGEAASAEAPRLAGSVRAHGELTGTLGALAAKAEGDVGELVIGPLRVAHGKASFAGIALGTDSARVQLTGAADSAAAWGHVLDHADFGLTDVYRRSNFHLIGNTGSLEKLRLVGSATRSADTAWVSVSQLAVGEGTPWRLSDTLRATIQPERISVAGLTLRRAEGQGTVSALGTLAWTSDSTTALPLDFRLSVAGVPFADYLRVVRSRATGRGQLDGALRITGTTKSPLIDADLTGVDVGYDDVRLARAFAELNYADDEAAVFFNTEQGTKRIFYGGGRIPLDLRFTPLEERRLARPLALSLTADSLPAGQVLPFFSGFSNVQGRINGTLRAAGTTIDPALSGEMRAQHLAATWSPSGVRYTDFNGSFKLISDRVVQLDATTGTQEPRRGLLAGEYGTGTVTGKLDFTQLTDPAFDLDFRANRVLAAQRRDVEAVLTGDGHLGGRYRAPELTASLRVDRGTMYLDEVYRQFFVVQLDSARVFQFVDTSLVARRRVLPITNNPFLENLNIRSAQIAIGNDSWLRGQDLDVEVQGDLNVAFDRRADDLRMTGSLDVLRGTYQLVYPPLQSRRFQVRDGTIEFPGIPGIDPNLSITAVYKGRARNEPLDIIALVSGSLQSPRVQLTSNEEPPISESDLASYLFFGVPTWEMGSIVGTQNTDARQALTGLGLRTFAPSLLGYASSGLQTIAQSVGLFDYVSLSSTESEPGTAAAARARDNFLASAQLDVGRYLTPDLYFGLSQRFAASSGEPAVRLEWRFHPTFTLELFSEDRFARNAPSFGYSQEAALRRVYGFFLFREWGY